MSEKTLVQRKDELLKNIDDGFSGSRYPGHRNIVRGPIYKYDDSENTYKCYKGVIWESIDHPEKLRIDTGYIVEVLSWLSPVAMRYYLPAFMKLIISDYPGYDLGNFESELLSKLTRQDEKTKYFDLCYGVLKSYQKEIVGEFLLYLGRWDNETHPSKSYKMALDEENLYLLVLENQDSPAFRALNSYWKDYLPEKVQYECMLRGEIW